MKFKYSHLLVLNLIILVSSYFLKSQLSSFKELSPLLKQEPIQTSLLSQKESKFEYRGSEYTIYPQAKYDLYGLVVTHNNITGLSDIYHDKNSVDTKDLCIIWGDNIKNNEFQKVSYSSGSWTCYFRYGRNVSFNKDQLSNNHLITDKQSIRDLISKVGINDQIHIQGYLVNYKDSKNPKFLRKTSLTRKDTGGTACEVVFVENIKILSSPNKKWRSIYKYSFYTLIFLLLFPILSIVIKEHFL